MMVSLEFTLTIGKAPFIINYFKLKNFTVEDILLFVLKLGEIISVYACDSPKIILNHFYLLEVMMTIKRLISFVSMCLRI